MRVIACRDAAAIRVSPLDRLGLLYTTGRATVLRLTLAGHQTGRPLEAIMMTHIEQTGALCNKPPVHYVADNSRQCRRLSWSTVSKAAHRSSNVSVARSPLTVLSELPSLSSDEVCRHYEA